MPAVRGEPVEIAQIVTNLLSNSVKYSGEGKTPEIEVTAEPVDDRVRIKFTDNGIGIDAKDSDRIFMMFQRLHAPGTYEGSGVGLALVKSIAQKHGGSAWLDTEFGGPGLGSRFVVELPAWPE